MAVDTRFDPLGFMHLLSSAASEWVLIILLFVHASLSSLLSKFADYCRLQTPCMFCSRLGDKSPGSYHNHLCNSHRREISCLVSCSLHHKFADVHSMCDDCLSPIVNRSKSSSDSYRLLVGKSLLDVDRSVLQNLVLNKHVRLGSPDHRTCSCCGKTWKAKSGTERLMEFNSNSKSNTKPPLPRTHFSRRDSLKRLRDKLTNDMSHVGYTKLKVSEDSESEFPFSEDDDDTKSGVGNKQSPPDLIDLRGHVRSLSVDVAFDWKESSEKSSSCISTPGILSLGIDSKPFDVSGDNSNVILPRMQALSVLSEFLSLCNVPSSPNKIDIAGTSEKEGDKDTDTAMVENRLDIAGTSEKEGDTNTDKDTAMVENNEAIVEPSSNEGDTPKVENKEGDTDTDKAKVENKEAIVEPSSDEGDTAKVENKEAIVEPSSDEGDTAKVENKEAIVEPSSDEAPSLVSTNTQSASSEEKASNLEPGKETSQIAKSDTEGDNLVESLKRELEHDKNLLANLYRDLEEERNASAIATNQAMAMITRLQEEKAALHMEALQYLRMMEEQAEYDMEAIGRANEILAEKEKEVQDLEIELEFYRNNFLDESAVHNLQSENENIVSETKSGSQSSFEGEKAYILQCLETLEKTVTDGSEKVDETSLKIEEDGLVNGKGNDFGDEVGRLRERLEAVEVDRDFVKRSCEFLGKGKEGLELVEEIAQHLRELRRGSSEVGEGLS